MTARSDLAALRVAAEAAIPEREADPGQQWKCGDEFLPFHRAASHIEPDYRDGWNDCYGMAARRMVALLSELEALRAREAQPRPTQAEIVGAVARGWCHQLNMHKTMDPEIALAVASEVSALFDAPAPASQPDVIEAAMKGLEEDSKRLRLLMRWLRDGHIPGPGYGKRIKLVEVDPMYGEERELSGLEGLIDAALRAALKETK